MKRTTFLCSLMLIALGLVAQPQWSVPIQIMSGNTNDIHPAFMTRYAFSNPQEEWLAFSRNGLNVCVIRTAASGEQWDSIVVSITTDAGDHDYPSLAGIYNPAKAMLLWQGRAGSNLKILYSVRQNDQWSAPQSVNPDRVDERYPCVAVYDTTFGAVWERGGRIAYAEYRNGSWSSTTFTTLAGDSLNSLPQLTYLSSSPNTPVVVWTSRRPSDSTSVLKFSYRRGGVWIPAETLYTNGDNRRPRFSNSIGAFATLNWESKMDTRWQIYGTLTYWDAWSNRLVWYPSSPLFPHAIDQASGSFNSFSIITDSPLDNLRAFYYLAGAWESWFAGDDSITLSSYGGQYVRNIVAAPSSSDRGPVMSTGVFPGSGDMLIWTVWQNNSTGQWKLYGTKARHQIAEVEEDVPPPFSFELAQNYPNPFNPTTTIKFDIPGSGFVTLRVFDLLGREVATLVNEEMKPGRYDRIFDGAGLASGIFFYHLTAGNFSQTKKLVLVR